MQSAIYLRKSRMEEGMETEEVLSRHQKALLDYAMKHNIEILETYYEVVSGESLYARPEMLRLLEDVEDGNYDAVLVMDLDRLSRGRMKDQGIILDAFRDSETLLITPDKTFNLADDMDDELAEFKTFLSRREYKIINKRLRRGLMQSIQDGYYVSNAPYGYRRSFLDKRPTLEIAEEEAFFVRMIFALYIEGYGCTSIANQINLLGARPHRTNQFSRNSVAMILRNQAYIGKIVWNQRKHLKKGASQQTKQIIIKQPQENWLIVDGIHPSIISQEIFDRAQEILSARYRPSKKDGTIKYSLAGLIRCQNCGRYLQRMVMKGVPYLLCVTPGCCASAKYEYVEARLLQHLEATFLSLTAEKSVKPSTLHTSLRPETLTAIRRELTAIEHQKTKLHDLLELGVYDLPTFRTRLGLLLDKTQQLEEKERNALNSLDASQQNTHPQEGNACVHLLDCYKQSAGPQRNAILHSVIDVVWYAKPKKTKPTAFFLQVDLKPF